MDKGEKLQKTTSMETKGGLHLKRTGVLWYLLEVRKTDLVPLRLLSLKMSFSRSFYSTFKGNELKKLVSVNVFL